MARYEGSAASEPDPSGRRPRRRARREPGGGRFDALDAASVDRKARALLAAFYRTNDRRPFEELVAVAEPLLSKAAHAITRELGLAIDPAQLVGDHLGRLFVELRQPPPQTVRFVHAARSAMRADAERRLAALQGGLALREAGLVGADGAAAHGEPLAAGLRPSAHQPQFVALVNDSFHSLSDDDRRLLLAADVDRRSLGELSKELKVSERMVLRRLVKARGRLSASIAATFFTIASDGTDRMEPA